MKFAIDNREAVPYTIDWLSEVPFLGFTPVLESISFYDEGSDEEVEIYNLDTDVVFDVNRINATRYEIGFHGTIEFDLTPEQELTLKGRDYSVDYCVQFNDSDGEPAESDDDYEFIENQNITIEEG